MSTADFQAWINRGAWVALVGVAALMVSWGGWVTNGLQDRPTRMEVSDVNQEMYRQFEKDLKTAIDNQGKLATVVERNTDALVELRVEIARQQVRDEVAKGGVDG